MSIKKWKIKNYLASRALQSYYRFDKTDDTKEMKAYCLNYMDNGRNLKKIYFRMIKTEINRKIVDIALKSMSEEYQNFAKYRYKYNERLVYISMKLNVSISQLGLWDQYILTKVSDYMHFHISYHDAYNRDTIINMISILGELIRTFEQFDQEYQIVSKYYVQSLLQRREKFTKVLFILNDYIRNKDLDISSKVMYEQIQHPYESQTQLAARCHCNKSMVSRQIGRFNRQIRVYIS